MEKKQQFKNTVIYLVPVFFGNLLPFLTLPIFTRILVPEDYGVLAIARVYAILVSGFANFGLAAIFERNFFTYDNDRDRKGLLAVLVSFVGAFCLIFITLTYFFKENISLLLFQETGRSEILFWSLVAFCLSELKIYFLLYFKNNGNAKTYVKAMITESLLLTIVSLVLVAGFRVGVMGLVMGHLVGAGTVLVSVAIKNFRPVPALFSTSVVKENMKISYPLIPRIVFKTIDTQIDKYMISLLATLGGAGVYNIGQKFSLLVTGFMDAVSSVFRPQVYQKMFLHKEKGGPIIGNYLTPFFFVCVLFTFLVICFCEEAFLVLTPPSYYEGINVAILLCLYYLPSFFAMQPQLLYAKKVYLVTVISVVGMLISVGINIPFIKIWGTIGAAWGMLIGGLITAVIYFYAYQKYYKIHWAYKKIVPPFAVLILVGIWLVISREAGQPYLYRLLIKGGGLAFMIFWGKRLDILTQSNFNAAKTIVMEKFRSLKAG